jgi:hypothetical protein
MADNHTIIRGGKADLVYGESGTGKTSLIGSYARYIYEVTARKYGTGMRTRLITMDGGGWDPINPEIEAGIIEVLPLINNTHILTTMDALSQGFWPDLSKVALEGGYLAPEALPKLTEWQRPANMDFKAIGVGAYAIEGLTSFSYAIKRQLEKKGPPMGEKASYAYTEATADGTPGSKYFGSNRAYYGFIQGRALDILPKFASLPVERVLWTALESIGEEDGQTIIGPKTAGKAITADVPAFVGQCLHLESYVKEKVKVQEVEVKVPTIKQEIRGHRMYFRAHPDPVTGRLHKCKARIPPAKLPELMEEYPGGFVELTPEGGFDKYLHFVDKLEAAGIGGLSSWKAKIDEEATVAASTT